MDATLQQLANAISRAPAWALISLTMPDQDLRERGAEELARWISTQVAVDRAQLKLSL